MAVIKAIAEQRDISCDFCSDKNHEWVYPVDDFTQQMNPASNVQHNIHMLGSWLACSTCHEFIENDQRAELATHSLESYGVSPDSTVYSALQRRVEQLHDEFFFQRSGDVTHKSEGASHDNYAPGRVEIEIHYEDE